MKRLLLATILATIVAAFLADAPTALAQTVTGISPSSAAAGSPSVNVTITGQFQIGAGETTTVEWYVPSADQETVLTIVGTPTSTQIVATIPATLLTQPESAEIFVNNNSESFQTFTVTVPPPTLMSLSPSTAVAGSPDLTLTVNGANFPGPSNAALLYRVTWNGTALQTTYINSGQLTAIVPAMLLATPGTASVSLSTKPAPAALPFTITAVPLVLSSISPTLVTAGSPGFTLTLNGSGFSTGTVATWNGASLSTTFVSATRITAPVPANLITTAGTAQVNVAAAGQTSPAPLSIAITPTVTSLSPMSTVAGGPAFTLTINGTGFSGNTLVYWSTQTLTASLVNANQVTVTVPASLIAQPGAVQVSIASNGEMSNAVGFSITAPPITLSSLSPNTAIAGGAAFTITANGSGFSNGSVVTWNGASLSTTFVSSAQLTAAVPANLIATAGTASVGVSAPGQVSPTPLPFIITPALTLTSLSPSTTVAGGASFQLSVNGSGFTSGTTILWNGQVLTTTVANANLLVATVPANLIAQTGSATIKAQNGNAVSNALPFTITAQPTSITITSLSPSSALAGSPAFTLAVNGSGFTSASVISWNGSPLQTTLVSSAQLTATVPANLLTNADVIQVSVTQATPTFLPFTIIAPLTLTAISPTTVFSGGGPFILTAIGTGFTSTTAITLNGSPLTTGFVSSRQINADVPPNLIATPGTVLVDVTPGSNQTTPPALQLVITPNLNLTLLSPSSATAGGPAFTLTVNGTGFASSATVLWNGAALPTNFVNSAQLTAAVGANLIAQAGSVPVTVGVGNLTSNALPFAITQPAPVIRSISPSSVIAGAPALTLTVNGAGFLTGAVVSLNGAPLSTTFVSATQVTAAVPATFIAQPGTAQVTLANPSGTASNSVALTITAPVPAITSLGPATIVSGGPAFTLTVNGTGFFAGATISFNGTALTTSFVSATQLTAVVPATLIAQPGTAQITTANNGGAASNATVLTITAPVPTITSIAPVTVASGGPAFTLTVNGTGFLTGATVSFNGTALTTTFVSATQLTAAVPANLVAQPGTPQIAVANTGGAASNAAVLTITAPVPTITSIAPATAASGGPAFTLAVNGTGFLTSATVSFNGTALTTTFVSATQLTAAVPANLVAQPGTAQITVANTGGAASNAAVLTITPPTPAITSISPSTVPPGGPAFTLTITGTNFLAGAVASFNGNALTTTFVSATELTIAVPANLVAQPGTAQITVANTAGAASNAVTLTILAAAPTITSLSPSAVTAGGAAFTLTVTGTNFVSGATVALGTTSLTTTFVSSTQLTAIVPASLILQAASTTVTVTDPTGPPSSAAPFTINPVQTISSISPSSVAAGGPALTLTINGSGFQAGALVNANGTSLSATLVSPAQLTVLIPASVIAQAGSVQITVGSGGAQSNAVTLTVTPPPPTLTSISPNSANVGDPAFTLTLSGTGFVAGSQVEWNGQPLGTTFVSSTQLTAAVDAGKLSAPGTVSVTMQNQVPNGPAQVSNALTFTINPVTPAISSLAPNSAVAGSAAFSLTINGSGFISLTTIQWNATALTTHFVNATQVTADVPATLVAQAGTAAVTAVNPGNKVSAAVTFTINLPVPVITSISQTSVTAGSAAFTLTVTGTGFVSGAVVNLGSTALATTLVSATQLSATVFASLVLTPGNYPIEVQQGTAVSNTVTLTISLPAPPTLRLNPPTTTGPATEPPIDFGLNSGYPLPLNGTVTLTFASNATVPVTDPAIQFATGGTTFMFTVPANTTTLPALMVQTGTVSGVITIKVTLTLADGTDVTPATGSTTTITVAKSAPVIHTVKLIHAAGYLEVDINAFSTPRDMTTAVFQLNAAPGGSFTSSVITVPVSPLFTTWYQSPASIAVGSMFTYAQPFTVIGDTNEVVSVTVTLTNSAGTSVSTTSN